MPIVVIQVSIIRLALTFLLVACRSIEINHLENDSVFRSRYSINNFDYYSFCDNLEVSVIGNSILVSRNGEYWVSPVCRGHYSKMIMKHSFLENGIKHTLRVYSNFVIIHKTKLFMFMYKLPSIKRKRI
jgi:hypothetical protein